MQVSSCRKWKVEFPSGVKQAFFNACGYTVTLEIIPTLIDDEGSHIAHYSFCSKKDRSSGLFSREAGLDIARRRECGFVYEEYMSPVDVLSILILADVDHIPYVLRSTRNRMRRAAANCLAYWAIRGK